MFHLSRNETGYSQKLESILSVSHCFKKIKKVCKKTVVNNECFHYNLHVSSHRVDNLCQPRTKLLTALNSRVIREEILVELSPLRLLSLGNSRGGDTVAGLK
jgi:hypothetical protein